MPERGTRNAEFRSFRLSACFPPFVYEAGCGWMWLGVAGFLWPGFWLAVAGSCWLSLATGGWALTYSQ